jgi:hypothetical protein
MLERYHAALLAETLGAFFSPRAMRSIVAANLGQDAKINQLRPYLHFDNCQFAEGLAYIDGQHRLIALAQDPAGMWAAFGRLTHTAQDFYSHSNYVDLWLKSNGGLGQTRPDDIDGLDPALLNHPELRSGYFYLWRDFIYYLPLFKGFAKKRLVFPDSHEAMNLDEPAAGPRFAYSWVAARQRTLAEYRRVMGGLQPGPAARFHDRDPSAPPPDETAARPAVAPAGPGKTA